MLCSPAEKDVIEPDVLSEPINFGAKFWIWDKWGIHRNWKDQYDAPALVALTIPHSIFCFYVRILYYGILP